MPKIDKVQTEVLREGLLRRMSQNLASSVMSKIYTGQVTKIQNAETQEHMTTKIVT